MGGLLETERLEGVIQLVDKQPAEVCVSNIDTHGLGIHAVGTIPMTSQPGMLSAAHLPKLKERIMGS